MPRPVTIVQIAKESGVSIATVSRVLNGSAPVAEETRKRVLDVIKARRYRPNGLARSLIRRRSMTVAILMPDIANPYFSAMFEAFEACARESGYSVLLCNSAFRASRREEMGAREAAYFRMMLDKQVDGVLIVGGQADLCEVSEDYRTALRELAEAVPVVVLGETIEDVDCLFIQRERGQGVFAAASYLASLGHRRIAFLGGEAGVGITHERLDAYRLALDALGLERDEALVSLSDYYASDGYRAARALLERKTPFTAALAMNDSVALGAVRALRDASLSVPEDVSVISCDRFPLADYAVPRLSGIEQHNEIFGRFVINALFGAMQGERGPILLEHRPELIIAESCAPPRGAAEKGETLR